MVVYQDDEKATHVLGSIAPYAQVEQNIMVLPMGFEPMPSAPKAEMIVHYTMGVWCRWLD